MHTQITIHKAGPTTTCPCPPSTHQNKATRDSCEITHLISTMISDPSPLPPSPHRTPVNPTRSAIATAEIKALFLAGSNPCGNQYRNDARFRTAVARFELRCPAELYSADDFVFIPHGRFISGRVKYYYFYQLRMLFGDKFPSVDVMVDAFQYTPGDEPRGFLAFCATAPCFETELFEVETIQTPIRESKAIAIVDPTTQQTKMFATPLTTTTVQVQMPVPMQRRGRCAIAIVNPDPIRGRTGTRTPSPQDSSEDMVGLFSSESYETTPDREGRQAVK